GRVRRPDVGAILLARGGKDGQLARIGLEPGIEPQKCADVEKAPAEHGAIHQDAEGAADAATALGDRVEDRAMGFWHLLAPGDRLDPRRGQRWARERQVRVPDIAAVLLARGRADGELGVRRPDDAVAVEKLADLVPGAGEARAVQHDGRRAADPAAQSRELVEKSVVLGREVVSAD